MIQIEKEPKELYEQFKVYENCKFCLKETNTWHKKTNTPICKDCAKNHKLNEIIKVNKVMEDKNKKEKKDTFNKTKKDIISDKSKRESINKESSREKFQK